jgi:hypothetical protein
MSAQSLASSPTNMSWPFPPPGGPVPWTRKQIQEHARQQRQRDEQDRAKLPPAPF